MDLDHDHAVQPVGGLRAVPALVEGYAYFERGDLEGARAYFREFVAREPTPEALEALGMAAWLLRDETTVFEAREAAYERFRARGDRLGAGRIATWLAGDSLGFRGEPAVANGWLRRARSHLDGIDPEREHGWLTLMEADSALMLANDSARSASLAANAIALGRRFGDVDLEMYGLAVEGLALVTGGAVSEGMSRLDEAAAACLVGEVREPWVISSVLCYMMDGCDRARDWDRAREWFHHVDGFATRWSNRELYALCRPHYAVVLIWRGAWEEAEEVLARSIDDAQAIRRPMAIEAIVRLADLRWRQGRLDAAAALFEQVKHQPLAQLGRAALALDQGAAREALELVELCLRRLPNSDRLERLLALDLLVRACLADGDVEQARQAGRELSRNAEAVGTRPVRATAEFALGLVAEAEGRLDIARTHLRDAVDLFEASEAPFELGRACLALARVLGGLGRSAEAGRQAHLALETMQRLGAQLEAERARSLLSAIAGGTEADASRLRADGLTPREAEVLSLLATGMSNQEIAVRLVVSVRTVERHISNLYEKLGLTGRAARAAAAAYLLGRRS